MLRIVSALAVTGVAAQSAEELMAELHTLENDIEELMGGNQNADPPAPTPVQRQPTQQTYVPAAATTVEYEYAQLGAGEYACPGSPDCQRLGLKDGWIYDSYGDDLRAMDIKAKPKPPLRTDSTSQDQKGCTWSEHRTHDIGHHDIGHGTPVVKSRKSPLAKKLASCREQCWNFPGCHGFAFFFAGGDGWGTCEFKSKLNSKQEQIYESGGHDVWWMDNAASCKPRTEL